MRSGAFAIGLDVGGTHMRVAKVGRDGTILDQARSSTPTTPAAALAQCLNMIDQVCDDTSVAIGVGIPGQVDAATGKVMSGGFVDFSDVDCKDAIEQATNRPVAIENDATMALLGEAKSGAAQDVSNVVMMTIGTGIGGAILEQGRVLRGRHTAGQLGHIIVAPGGQSCVCGRYGCVEAYSSGTAFARHLAEAGLPPDTRIETLLDQMSQPDARNVIENWARPLRNAIDTLIAVTNPDRVLIGGGMGQAAIDALQHVTSAPSWFDAPVLPASLGDAAGVIGAAEAAFQLVKSDQPNGKRVILVNGVPASGKSNVARMLSDATGWPLLTLDTIKNPFLAVMPSVDRDFNRTLGKASYAAIFDLLADAPNGSTMILDAWFGFQPDEVLSEGLSRAGISAVAEIWCNAPPETIGQRYLNRSGSRLPGHPGSEYVPELIELAARAKPMELGPTLHLDTTKPISETTLINWIARVWPSIA